MRSIELFVGAGGFAMGASYAGFEHDLVIERDKDTCLTIIENQRLGLKPLAEWRLIKGDVKDVDYSVIASEPDLVSGGPPCQPFSLGGKHRGHQDDRDGFPEAVRAVREMRPKAFIFENVKGLLRQSFTTYFEYVILQLTHPEIIRRECEEWGEHLSRLEANHTSGPEHGLHYRVVFRLLNAADYGVPQRRERVFIVGFRSDLGVDWSFPNPTHSREALLHEQWKTGDYWERHKITAPELPIGARREVWHSLFEPDKLPWRTVRDAIGDLPDPETDLRADLIVNHWANPGARSYPGHTGSPWDEPSKTLKAGDHGVPGGENTLAFTDGRVRYYTVREAARIQTFPDDYIFPRSWTESMRQLGNAVPVELGRVLAQSVAARLNYPQVKVT